MDVRVNGINLFYTDDGDSSNPPVVFLHGFPFDHTMWKEQVALLKDSHRIITYDHRGHGRSDVSDGQYTVELFVDDLFALLDYLKIKKAIVVGLSMGGYVALRAVEREPERFRALVLCDTRAEGDSSEARLKRAATIKLVKNQGVATFTEGFLKGAFAVGAAARLPEAVESIRNTIKSTAALGICGSLLALAARADTTEGLSKIGCPVLILVGAEDTLTPPAASENLQRLIPAAQLFVIPESGHLSNVENPAVFNEHLRAFVRSL